MHSTDLTPGLGNLPDYLQERMSRAMASGLYIKRFKLIDNSLSLTFDGLPDQYLKSGFVTDEAAFLRFIESKRKNAYCPWRYLNFYTAGFGGFPLLTRRDNGLFRVTIGKEPVPDETEQITGRVKMFRFLNAQTAYDGEIVHVYVGPDRDSLMEAKVAPEAIKNREWWRGVNNDKQGEIIWSVNEAYGMVYLYRYVTREQQAWREEDDLRKRSFKSPEDYSHMMSSFIEDIGSMISRPSECRNGFTYSFPSDTINQVQSHLAAARAIISQSRVISRRNTALRLVV